MNATFTTAVPTGKNDIPIDRANIDAEGRIQLVTKNPEIPTLTSESSDENFDDNEEGGNGIANGDQHTRTHLSKRKRFSLKTKKLLHIKDDNEVKVVSAAPVLADAEDTISDERLTTEKPTKESNTLKDLAHKPIDTVTSKVIGQGGHQAAANLVAKEISHGKEVEFVKAYDAVLQARTETARLLAMKELDALKVARQDMFVRWTMDRHVTKVRILPYKEDMPRKRRSDFVTQGPDIQPKVDNVAYAEYLVQYYAQKYGGEYIGYTSDPPEPTKENLIPNIERFLIASAPFQTLSMTVRHIYRWENRNETLKYLLGYLALWLVNMVLPGVLFGIIYLIVHRKTNPPSMEDLRKDIIRTEDLSEAALTLSEFIEKRGDELWVDPIIQELGPWALIQLADLANMTEIIRNFYEWRVPVRSATIVSLLCIGLVAVTFTPVWLLVRVTTLMAAMVFFGLFPISSRYPDYRLLASPIRWIFWKIPTHAEWAVKSLQAEASKQNPSKSASHPQPTHIEPAIEDRKPDPLGYRGTPDIDNKPVAVAISTTDIEPAKNARDLGSYKCSRDKHPGRLIISTAGLRFETTIRQNEGWYLKFEEVERMEKVTRQVKRNLTKESGLDLKFTGPQGVEYTLKNVDDRDQAFSQIVGYSPVKWQVVW